MFSDQDLLFLLLITGKNRTAGENISCSGEVFSEPDPVTSRVSQDPASQDQGAGAGHGLTGSCRAAWSWGFLLLCQQQTRVSHSGSPTCSWAKQLSFKEQQVVCCRADGMEN